MEFPKIIHQIWIQGELLLPDNFKQYQNEIKKYHPDWKYMLWDEINILELLKKNNIDWLKQYYKFQYMHQRIDYAKLIILYLYGGIFIDMDAYTIKNLQKLFDDNKQYDFVISKLANLSGIANFSVCGNFTQCFNNGNFISKPKNDILNYMIKNISDSCNLLDNKVRCIGKTTGPVFFNKIIQKYIDDKNITNKSSIKILDHEYLEPCLGKDKCDITDNTFVVHKHENSWMDSLTKVIIYNYIHNKNKIIIMTVTVLFLIFKLRYT